MAIFRTDFQGGEHVGPFDEPIAPMRSRSFSDPLLHFALRPN